MDTVLGATGLVGRAVAGLLAARGRPLTLLARRPCGVTGPSVTERVVDFADPAAVGRLVEPGDLYCCLGTTLKKAGSPAAFRAVDLDMPLALLRAVPDPSRTRLFLVSSAGADARSAFLYSRVKGELEAAAAALPFKAVHIARPSLLLGPRAESRPAEALAQALSPWVSWLLPARLRPIAAETVARALVGLAESGQDGVHIHESDALAAFTSPLT